MAKEFQNSSHNIQMGDPVTSSQAALTDIKFSSGMSKKVKWIIIVLLVVFFILAVVFIGLYIYEKHGRPDPPKRKYCNNEGCIKAASSMLRNMNSSVDPCEDFHEYACGKWMKRNPIPNSRTIWSHFHLLTKDNEEVISQLILNPKIRAKYSKNKALVKAFDYFDSCMNEREIEKLDGEPLQKLIKDFGSWNVTDKNFSVSSWDFMEVFVGMHKYLGIKPLFNMKVGTNLEDSTKHIIEISQYGFEVSRESYLFNTTYNNKVRRLYKVFMTDLMKLLGAGDEAGIRMEEVFNFEKQLAKIAIPKKELLNIDKIHKKMTLKKLMQEIETTGFFNMTVFLERMFVQTGYKITENEEIGVYGLQYFKNVTQLINSADKRIMANYMMWNVVNVYAKHLSPKYTAVYNQYNEGLDGTSAPTPRTRTCIDSVQEAFGMAIGLLFVEKTFAGESKTEAEEMIHNIRNVFIDNMKNVDWMDSETKKAAEDKAEAMRENIGYPKYITDPTALAKDYEGFNVTKTTYFLNTDNGRKLRNMKNYEKISKKVDKTIWEMFPPVVNAYYSPNKNKMVFLAGILQTPFFDLDFPKWLNYGSIGMVVGHEISHGFDNRGRKYNKDGNKVVWWSNTSIANFKKKAECLVKQYSNYTFHGLKVNGLRTLGENIADNGGLKAAYQAYELWKEKHGEEQMLPGLEEFSQKQLFFLGFAQIWCSAYRKSAAIKSIKFGVHSPAKIRVIGSLSNNYEFAKAYGCPVGSKMNPQKKCSVW